MHQNLKIKVAGRGDKGTQNFIEKLFKISPKNIGRFFVFGLIIGIFWFSLVPLASAASGVTIATSSHSQAIGSTFQNKLFYANGLWWVFYDDNFNFKYVTSSDGITWSLPIIVLSSGSNGSYMDVEFDGTYIYYAHDNGTTVMKFRRGAPLANGTITWSALQNITLPTNSTVKTVAVDSNGYYWISYVDANYPYVLKSSTKDGTWTNDIGFPYQLTATSGSYSVALASLTNGKMYVLYGKQSTALKGKLWDGSLWGTEESASSNIYNGSTLSVVANGDDVHAVFQQVSTLNIKYIKRTYSTSSWSADETVQASTASGSSPALSLDPTTGNLFCIWSGSPTANHLYYKKYVNGTWDSLPVDYIDESSDTIQYYNNFSVAPISYLNNISVIYQTLTSSPYNIKFATIPAIVVPTVDTSTTGATSNTTESLSGNITDTGGQNSTVRGFQYGLTNLYGSDVNENGSFPAGSYSLSVNGLNSNTLYHFRAYATNSIGTSYGPDTTFTTAFLTTDYYASVINTNGTLAFFNKSTGSLIVNNTPTHYFDNSGNALVTDTSPINPSFETDSNSDGVPDNWTANKTYITSSSLWASSGTSSLRFNMVTSDAQHRNAYSSVIPIDSADKYKVTLDYHVGDLTSGNFVVFVYYYASTDGTGSYKYDYISNPGSTLVAGETTNVSTILFPPLGTHSAKIVFYSPNTTVADFYFDNLAVTQTVYEKNTGAISSTVSTNGDITTVTSTDNSSPNVTLGNSYSLNTHSPNITYTATLTYKNNVTVPEERFDFAIPSQTATVMTKDLVLNSFNTANEYYSDPSTPKIVKFDNGLSFLGNDTMQSMRLKTDQTTNSQVSFYSDYNLNHPYDTFLKNVGTRVDKSNQTRVTGESYSSSITFSIDPGATLKTLAKARQPYGYDATLTLTNHADNEILANANAIAYGTEDTSSSDYGTKGLLGRGLSWTKSVFVSDAYSGYLDLTNTEFKALIDKMYQEGYTEIVGHSITPSLDSRTTVSSGLATLSQYNAKGWIDHGAAAGTSNWEDLASQGAIKGDPNYILDLLAQYNYTNAWSYIDIGGSGLNLLRTYMPQSNLPFFYYNNNVDDNPGHDTKIYLWSTKSGSGTASTNLANANIDDLISQRGVCDLHTYLGMVGVGNNDSYYTNSSNGKVEVYPTFDDELIYIATKIQSGLLWNPTNSVAIDYWALLPNVSVMLNVNGSYTVTNNNDSSITGVTLLAESVIQSVTIDGKELTSFGESIGDKELVLPTLTSGQSVNLNIIYGTKDTSVPTIVSNDTGKNKINEVSGYWDNTAKLFTMTAEGKSGEYSFTATIPLLANKKVTVEDTGTNTTIGSYTADSSGEISFTAHLGSIHNFEISEDITLPIVSSSSISNSGMPVSWSNKPIVPVGGFTAIANGNTLNFNAGSDVKKMAISLDSNFTNASLEDYKTTKQINSCSGSCTVYIKFYTEYGVASDVISQTINPIIAVPTKPVIVIKDTKPAPYSRLAGQILIQVESHGEAWYVNPKDNKRYYLGRPDDAFNLMKTLSLGISEKEFASWANLAPTWAEGGLYLRPQSHGEAYYVDLNRHTHYLGRPLDAWLLLKSQGLGITNKDLAKVVIAE